MKLALVGGIEGDREMEREMESKKDREREREWGENGERVGNNCVNNEKERGRGGGSNGINLIVSRDEMIKTRVQK